MADLERLDRVSWMILAGDSQYYWFLSALLVQLKEDGYQPSNPSLFDKSISSLSSALATQTNVTSCLSEFITAKRRESYLSHSSFTLPESLKRDLLVAPGTDSLLFNQPLLSSAIENMKEDSLLLLLPLWLLSRRRRSNQNLKGILVNIPLFWTPLVLVLQVSASVLLPLIGVGRSAAVAAGVRLLPLQEAGVFGGRSHVPVQPL